MLPSQAPPERPAKVAESATEPGSLSRFKKLAAGLFRVNPEAFREARKKDEAERQAKRRS
jgi:hypothetical protein